MSEKILVLLNGLEQQFLNKIKFLYIFDSNKFIVTEDDKVFATGSNSKGVLGFGHNNEVNEFTINEELSHKQIIDFTKSISHVIARTINGKVYCWGSNESGVLGNGKNDYKIYKPGLIEYLNDKNIIDICCGGCHSLVLTKSGEVYAWGCNDLGQIGNGSYGFDTFQLIPIKLNGFDEEKVVMISCGKKHSMALTESGRVFSWGNNSWGQLGLEKTSEVPSNVLINKSIPIKKISCGQLHSLMLTNDGDIYWFGKNGNDKQITREKLYINSIKFKDIASHYNYNFSIALSTAESAATTAESAATTAESAATIAESAATTVYYICGHENIPNNLVKTEFKSFNDIFSHYSEIPKQKVINYKLDELKIEKYHMNFLETCFISSGGFGVVCKSKDKKSQEFFAIKKVPLRVNQMETVRKESIIANLNDKYVVQCYDVWIEENYLLNDINKDRIRLLEIPDSSLSGHKVFDPNNTLLLHIQMELGFKTLKDIIISEIKNHLTDPLIHYIASELFIEVLECVQYLHEQRYMHRDLKPSNVLITYGINGRFIKLCDFGLSVKHEINGKSHTQGTGSDRYRAPEVNKGRSYDFSADIYSLGVITDELFDIDIK
jgi:alpha-tubulin suppressor-like RCC1 family protein